MKKLITAALMAFLATGMLAQYIYTDFDANQNENLNGWPNIPALIANPDPSGVNTSGHVGEWERSGEQWAHIYCELDGKIDFSTGTIFYMKVWSPIACQALFKLEDKTNSGIFTEVPAEINTTGAWLQLEFDFSGASSGVYDKIVIFLDFATTVNNTYYIDDIEGPEYSGGTGPKPLLAADVQDNFENDGWSTIEQWYFQDPELLELSITTDPASSSNHVADYARSGSFQYTNAQTVLGHRMDLTGRHVFTMDVYFPSSNTYGDDLTPTAAIKLQNSLMGPNAWMSQTEIKLEVTSFDEWVTMEFDFAAAADSTDYDQIVVQMGGEGHFIPGQFYFDNFELQGTTGIRNIENVYIGIFPNPASRLIRIDRYMDITSVNIYSISGQVVYQSTQATERIDVSGLESGLYLLEIRTKDGQQAASRFIKE